MQFNIAGDCAVIVTIADHADEAVIAKIQSLMDLFELALGPLLLDITPSYTTLLIEFDALQTDHDQVIERLKTAAGNLSPYHSKHLTGKLVRLPVYYAEETGPDLQRIADHHGISTEEVISVHCQNIYRVYAIGFAPGFAYLGHVHQRIAMPRLDAPRPTIARGSVAIADQQTSIYPASSPGGWNIIGRCPSLLFNPDLQPPMPYQVGDQVQFMPISREEFLVLGGEL